MITKKEFKEFLMKIDSSFNGIHNNAALFYGQIKQNKLNILEFYYYDLKNNKIVKYNVFIKKDFIFSDKYLTFRFKKNKFFNKKINWKILKYKTIFNRLLKSIYLFNNYKFNSYIINKEVINVKNIQLLYNNHLIEIKKQFICFQLSKHFQFSYEYLIKNYDKILKGNLNNIPIINEK